MTIWHMRDLDVVFISYDEECADEHYALLVQHAPRPPLRVHGVKGFHNAYLRASNIATTPRFITVDGDNRIRAGHFFAQSVDDRSLNDIVFSFDSRNSINGLMYGNGGIKCWPKELLRHVNTHEEKGDGLNAVDFNHTCRYYSTGILASDTLCGVTPYHAFRAGYREAIKLSLPRGGRGGLWHENAKRLHAPVINWLKVWLSVGVDMPNGIWSILGARVGLIGFWRDSFPLEKLSDYAYFSEVWRAYAGASESDAYAIASALSKDLLEMQLSCPILDADASKWFKSVFIHSNFAGAFDPTKPSPMP